ncbi:polysaccharide deacetylase family protein [Marinobacter sp. DUT-1]|uniref:polysaccharide deacetylase family protein n=1 Tax=Marinobacter sp. DUT-1 TaxID=3412037 RepID=UPI003D16EC0A
MSRLILRFDIDTIACLKKGVPPLLALARQEDLPMTFFANLGKAVNWSGVVRSRLERGAAGAIKAESLAASSKLGWPSLLRTVIMDPLVSKVGRNELKDIEAQGHDLGLHGGKNHSAWHHGAREWSEARLRTELDWGIKRMEALGLKRPKIFASPGFTNPDILSEILRELGFKAVADRHGWALPALGDQVEASVAPIEITTGMLGEPGAIGFVEYLVAKGLDPKDLPDILEEFINANQTYVLYDHPCFSGGQGYFMLKAIIKTWQSLGGQFVKISDLIN